MACDWLECYISEAVSRRRDYTSHAPPKKRAALRRNPTTRATCVALDKSVHEGKGKCKPGKGIFCNARNCWAKKECALCEP